jgi:hypothetical protein
MTRVPKAGVQGAIAGGRGQLGLHFLDPWGKAGGAGTLVKSATATDTNGVLPVRVGFPSQG